MTRLQYGREGQNERSRCPTHAPPLQLTTLDKLEPNETRTGILPKSVGICPECGTEQVGNVYRISPVIAKFLGVKSTDTFLPDKHRCIRKVAPR
jgi:hypothetical protein